MPVWAPSLQDGHRTCLPLQRHHRRSSSPCPSDTCSGHGGAATPVKDGPAAAAEWTRDAADNGDTDLNAPTAEEAAISTERTANAHFIQRQFAPTCDPRFNHSSNFSPVLLNADSN